MNAQYKLLEAAVKFLENAKECEQHASQALTSGWRAMLLLEAQTWLSAAKYLLKE